MYYVSSRKGHRLNSYPENHQPWSRRRVHGSRSPKQCVGRPTFLARGKYHGSTTQMQDGNGSHGRTFRWSRNKHILVHLQTPIPVVKPSIFIYSIKHHVVVTPLRFIHYTQSQTASILDIKTFVFFSCFASKRTPAPKEGSIQNSYQNSEEQ